MALVDAVSHLIKKRTLEANPLHGHIASVSVGIYRGEAVLDLDYAEDSQAETDMNVVMNEASAFIEVQGTAEGHAFHMDEMMKMMQLAEGGIKQLIDMQKKALQG